MCRVLSLEVVCVKVLDGCMVIQHPCKFESIAQEDYGKSV